MIFENVCQSRNDFGLKPEKDLIMKILILTLPLDKNYGGILQCYALQTVLQRMGHNVKVLSKPQYGLLYFFIYPLAIVKRLFKRYILGKDVLIWYAPHEIVKKNINVFVNRYISRLTKRKWTQKIGKQFDAIVVGSDQVWRPEYFWYSSIEDAFLNFVSKCSIKRVAYAASFGVDHCEYTEEQLKKCSLLIQHFDAVSVREFSGIEICEKYFGVKACQKIDPTLLLDINDYEFLIDRAETNSFDGDLLAYILDETEEKKQIINTIVNEKQFKVFNVIESGLPIKESVYVSVEQWLRGFRDSKFVVTDSFHGCIFSIIFNKPFIVIGNAERGMARFTSLLKMFSLENRLLTSLEDLNKRKIDLLKPINYSDINLKLQTLKEESFLFLKQSLE